MEFTVQYSFEDFREGMGMLRAVQQKRVKREWRMRVISGILFVFIAVPWYFAGTGLMDTEWGRVRPFSWACVGWVLASMFWVGFLIVMAKLQQRKSDVKSWESLPSLRFPYRVELSDRGLVMEREHARNEHGWPAMIRYGESAKMFLLYPNEVQFFMLPKRCLRGEEIEEIRELCRRYLGGESKGFPVEVGAGGGDVKE